MNKEEIIRRLHEVYYGVKWNGSGKCEISLCAYNELMRLTIDIELNGVENAD